MLMISFSSRVRVTSSILHSPNKAQLAEGSGGTYRGRGPSRILTDQQLRVTLCPTLDSPRARDIFFTKFEAPKDSGSYLTVIPLRYQHNDIAVQIKHV